MLEVLARAIRKEKEIGIQIRKEETELSLFADDIILCIENPKDSTKENLSEVREKFVKVSGFKINIQKSVAILYINNGLSKKEIKKTISFMMALRTIKHFIINLTKQVKDLYPENCKT